MAKAKSTIKIIPKKEVKEPTGIKRYRALFQITMDAADRGEAEAKANRMLEEKGLSDLTLFGIEEA